MPNGTLCRLTAADCFRVGKSYGLLLSPCPFVCIISPSCKQSSLLSQQSPPHSSSKSISPFKTKSKCHLFCKAIFDLTPDLSFFRTPVAWFVFSVPHLAFFIHSLWPFLWFLELYKFYTYSPNDMVNNLMSWLNLHWYLPPLSNDYLPTELSPLAKSKQHVDWRRLWPHVYSSTSKAFNDIGRLVFGNTGKCGHPERLTQILNLFLLDAPTVSELIFYLIHILCHQKNYFWAMD